MRDALKTKEPALTAKISLEGRLAAVVLDGGHGVRYSKQLPKETADHFREVLQSVTVPDGMTLVVRTAAGDAAVSYTHLCNRQSGKHANGIGTDPGDYFKAA